MAGNPAFRNSPAFTENAQRASQAVPGGQQAPYGQAPYGQAPYGQQPQQFGQPAPYGSAPYGQQQGVPTPEQLNQQFNRPAAGPIETERLTYDGVIMKTVLTLGVTAVGFIVTLGMLLLTGTSGAFFVLTYGGALVGFVLALVNIFKKEPSPALILAYAAAQGLFLGGFSGLLEFGMGLDGIIFQALLATACVIAATLALYAFRIVRTSPRMNKIFFIVLIGYGLFSLVNFGMMLFGATGDLAFGMRSAPSPLFGIPWGVLLGGLAVLLGAYSLVMDFEGIELGVKRGVHKKYGWSAAFGLTMTIIWLYVEILRIIAIVRGNN
ncbi:Bax inhibitor-1/YccA family protein [Agrococcus citreus]|uniref:Bax inhibitor-1/YccA family protein n=1 Tax=Agrococcus citreus TaxID=84643 RepID=A0ABP4JJQ2_9MICO